jgi:DNA-damage-inducible protein J
VIDMSDLASLNVKIDREIKKEADSIANSMGMTLSTAINIFVRQMVNERAIPFRVHMVDNDTSQFHQLIDSIRFENQEKGFLSDDEINEEIKAYRNEKRQPRI